MSRQNNLPSDRTEQRKDAHAPSAFQLTDGRIIFLLVAATVLVYANSLGGEFLFDDAKQIVGNMELRSWSNIWNAFGHEVWNFQRGTGITTEVPPPYYRPLFTIYFTFAFQLFGLWEPGWHLLNLLVHSSATVLVYFLVRRLSGRTSVAALAALLFGIHPTHVESVSWVSGIPDPLAALFYVPALLWFVRYREEGARRWLAFSLPAFALSLLCKETSIALPLVIAAWEATRKQRAAWPKRLRHATLMSLPFAAIAACYLILRLGVLGFVSWQHPLAGRASTFDVLLTLPGIIFSYLQHLCAPFYLSLLYGTSFVGNAADVRFLLPAALLAGLVVLVALIRRRLTPEWMMALALSCVPLLPVLNLKALHPAYLIQDRYLYLPSIGFCYALALAVAGLARRRQAQALALALLLVVAYGASTILQNRIWHNGVALWQRAVAHAPDYWAAHYNLGLAHMTHKNYEGARREFLAAVERDASVAIVYNNLALAQDKLGDEASAIDSLRRALALDDGLFEAHNNLGTILFRRGEHTAAGEQFARAYERDPSSVSVLFNLARSSAAMGDHRAATPLYETALARTPEDGEVRYYLGLSYAATGRRSEAITEIGRALKGERAEERASIMRAALDRLQSGRQ